MGIEHYEFLGPVLQIMYSKGSIERMDINDDCTFFSNTDGVKGYFRLLLSGFQNFSLSFEMYQFYFEPSLI